MKPRIFLVVTVLAALVSNSPSAVGQTSNRTDSAYQGRLKVNGLIEPNDRFDFRLRLFDVPTGGTPVAGVIEPDDVPVTDGLFTVPLDFGSNAFNGTPRWLEIEARRATNNPAAPYTLLTPRQRVSPVPTALHAQQADVARSFTDPVGYAQLPAGVARLDTTQTFTAPPSFMPASGPPFTVSVTSIVQNLNADLLDGLDATAFLRWETNGGVNRIFGPMNLPFEIHIQDTRVLRLERGLTVPNLIGGSSANTITQAVSGSSIAGGGGVIGPNHIAANGGFIGAGLNNRINANADHSVLAGGNGNQIAPGARESIIGGGASQRIGSNSINAGIFSGSANEVMANSRFAGVLLGANNKVCENSDFAAVLSGELQIVDEDDHHSVIAGGAANVIRDGAHSAFVGGGHLNTISTQAFLSVVVGGQANQIGSGAYRSAVVGGNLNQIGPASYNAFLGGGGDNKIEFNAPYSAILGGNLNVVRSNAGWATVLGGFQSIAGAPFTMAGGRGANALHSGSIVLADGQSANFASSNADEFAVRAAGGVRFVTAGAGLFVDGMKLTGGGGLVIPPGAIATSNLADGAVTGGKIASSQVVRSLNNVRDDVVLSAGEGLALSTVGNNIQIAAASTCGSAYSNCFWNLRGNGNITPDVHFLGTVAGELDPLDFRVNNLRGLRLQPDGGPFVCDTVSQTMADAQSPSLVGGYFGNSISPGIAGSVISGGGAHDYPCLEGNMPNRITAPMANIGGGLGNEVHGGASTVGGGSGNQIQHSANYCVIAGGGGNLISSAGVVASAADASTISGGSANEIRDDSNGSTISGGIQNLIDSNIDRATIGGGELNQLAADYATISGGYSNIVAPGAEFTTISGGHHHRIEPGAVRATIGGGLRNVIGTNAHNSTISGGRDHLIGTGADHATIGGGQGHEIQRDANHSTIGGGVNHTIEINAQYGAIGGGNFNIIRTNADYATIPGGAFAMATNYGQFAYASGRFAVNGDAQMSHYVLRRTTSNNATNELFLDGAVRRMVLPPDSTWTFDILVVARTTAGNSAGYQIRDVIENQGGVTRFVGLGVGVPLTATPLREDLGTWNVVVEADDANDALVIKVVDASPAPSSIRWVATVRTAEVIY